MRYLSQLARETTARVPPPVRAGSWMPVQAPFAEEHVVEWPAVAAASPAVATASQNMAQLGREASVPGDDDAPVLRNDPRAVPPIPLVLPTPAPVAAPAMPPPRDTLVTETGFEEVFGSQEFQPEPRIPKSPHRMENLPEPIARQAALPRRKPPALPPELPSAATDDRRGPEYVAPPPAARQPEQNAETATLQSVLAEIGRRQQELEQNYRANESAARPEPPWRGELPQNTASQHLPAEENIRLSIGSIVVRVEPEPAAPPPPKPPSRPEVPRHTSNRWARSFLDR